ncbi:MAG: GAF domain-containing protein, partial [Trueperaceae bacterium]
MNWRWNGEDPFENLAIDGRRGSVWRRLRAVVARRWSDAAFDVIVAGPSGLRRVDTIERANGASDAGPDAIYGVPDAAAVHAAFADGEMRHVPLEHAYEPLAGGTSGGGEHVGGAALLLPVLGPNGPVGVLRIARDAGFDAGERNEAVDLAKGVTARLIARRYALRARLADALAGLPAATLQGGAVAMAALSELVPIAGATAGTVLVERGGRLRTLADFGKDAIARKVRMDAGIPHGDGVAWQAVLEGRSRFVRSYPDDERALSDLKVDPHLFVLPVARQGVARWVLLLAFSASDPPTDDALALVEEVGPVLATVLELADRNEVEDRLTDLLERLPDVASETLPREILDAALASVPGADAGSIVVRDRAGGPFRVRASSGVRLGHDAGPELSEEAVVTWYAPEARDWQGYGPRVLQLPGASAWLRLARRVGHRPGADLDAFWREVRSDLSVPVLVDGVVHAMMMLQARTRAEAFDRDSLRVARQVAAAGGGGGG